MMFIFGNFFAALAEIISIAISTAYWLIIARTALSWFGPDPYNFLVQLLYKTTEPLLSPFRRIMPVYNIGLDISPIFAILALVFLRYFLVTSLRQIGIHFGAM